MATRRILRIFISSTAVDLREYRDKVRDSVLRLESLPIAMETFSAHSGQPASECMRMAADADAVICIVAHRYGYVPPSDLGGDGERSITWLEVDAAKRAGKPVFAFVVDPKAPWTEVKEQDRLTSEPPEQTAEIVKAVQKLKEFKAYLEREHMRSAFSSADELAKLVTATLANFDPQARVLAVDKVVSHRGVTVDHEDPEMPKEVPSAWDYGRMSLIAALLGIGLLVFYIYEARNLLPGVQNRLYFIILLMAALACSIALFGILRGKAHIRYQYYGTIVELSGAAALFALIVYYGSNVKGGETFDFTVRVHSAEKSIITSGTIDLDLGSDRRVEAIDAKGEANFKRIPPEFALATVRMLPKVEGYEETPQQIQIMGNVADITLVKAHYETTFRGSVVPLLAGKPLIVKVEGQDGQATVDKYGEFKLTVIGKDGDRVRVKVFSNGRVVYDDFQVLPGPAQLKLHNVR